MPDKTNSGTTGQGGQRLRKRLRGMLDTKAGKSLGIASVAAPIAGLIAHDLQKPDSVIRGLISGGVKRLLALKDKISAIDISKHAEISDNEKTITKYNNKRS